MYTKTEYIETFLFVPKFFLNFKNLASLITNVYNIFKLKVERGFVCTKKSKYDI